ncbi:Ribonuclease/ribotoxin [Massariosphaeria phaeospora]|uniref:Ribonuclease/ribotoxin n=1 Tax=Massariosphaeria phaeospora TaxID=100035 RepID=A0A7C8I239_9PLEO|nr:Ribonuclease/ribotoxin [Massariosphaeria phaeospora]
MRSPTSLVTCMLLAGTSLTSVACAYPAEVESQLSKDTTLLEARGLTVKHMRDPTNPVTCPASDNRPPESRNYAAQQYTVNQIKAAFRTAAILAANGKTVGGNSYPHAYDNNPPMPFDCKDDLQEFPIQLDGKTYDGGDIGVVPDRVLFEAKEKKGELLVKYCGVMRHGPPNGPVFIPCAETVVERRRDVVDTSDSWRESLPMLVPKYTSSPRTHHLIAASPRRYLSCYLPPVEAQLILPTSLQHDKRISRDQSIQNSS